MIIFSDTIQLATLLESAAKAHHGAQKRLPHHEWAEWYGAYLGARTERCDGPFGNKRPSEAEAFADEYIRVRVATGAYGSHAPEPSPRELQPASWREAVHELQAQTPTVEDKRAFALLDELHKDFAWIDEVFKPGDIAPTKENLS